MMSEKLPLQSGRERKSLYRERISDDLDEKIKILKDFETSEEGKNKLSEKKRIEFNEKKELSDEERAELLKFEKSFDEELDKIDKISAPVVNFHLDYFFSEKGRKDFEKIFQTEASFETEEDLKKKIFEKRNTLITQKARDISAVASESRDFSNEKIQEQLVERISESGEFDVEGLKMSERVKILKKPEKSLEKIKTLRKFKEKLKKEFVAIHSGERTDNLTEAKRELVKFYLKDVNRLIAERFLNGVVVAKMKDSIGEDGLSKEEKKIMELCGEIGKREKSIDRMDKFIYGASKEYHDGNHVQVSDEIRQFIEELEEEVVENGIAKENLIRKKGLDPEKITKKDIAPDQVQKFGIKVLDEAYCLKSNESHDYENYFESKKDPAKDGKWRFVIKPKRKSAYVNAKGKAVESVDEKISVERLISSILAHEVEGHVLQFENKSRIPVELFRKPRRVAMASFVELAGMESQDVVSQEAFGFKTLPKAHYAKAMMRKLEGGNYLDCVKACFESDVQSLVEKKRRGMIGEEEFQVKARARAKIAQKIVMRLFREEVSFGKQDEFLSRSKALAYAEQLMLRKRLETGEIDAKKIAYFGALSLEEIIFLKKYGLVNENEMLEPKFYALEIWDKIKGQYKLEETKT